MSKEFRTSVGGQALMEGIMMRGPEKICCAVRKPDGSIDLTYDTVTTRWYNKVPLVRGVCNMAENRPRFHAAGEKAAADRARVQGNARKVRGYV